MYKHLETKPFKTGERYMFIENLPLKREAGEPVGHMEAIDPLTAQKKLSLIHISEPTRPY